MNHHLMNAGSFCGTDDQAGVRDLREPRNIVGDCSLHQRDILRQVPNIMREEILVPLAEIGAIDPHRYTQERPDSEDRARQRGFATDRWTDKAKRLAWLQVKARLAKQDGPGGGKIGRATCRESMRKAV